VSGWAGRARELGPGAGLGALALVETIARSAPLDAGLLALCTTLPPALLPLTAGAVAVTAASVLSLAAFHTLTVAGACAQLVAGYRLAGCHGGWQTVAPGLVGPYLALALTGPRPAESEAALLTVLLAGLTPVAAWVGLARRARRDALADAAARRATAGTLLEHAARGERARIARDLHDVVAHHISMVAVQAEAARLATPGMPAAGAQRLTAIGDTARAALTEMRRLLGVLRESDEAERRPQPGVEQLNDLLDEARDATGASTRLILRGRPVPLDPGIELVAYRIVQEALTNVRRHAPGAAVDVELHYEPHRLRLRVRDNGPGPDPSDGGHGVAGMRERAAAVGGCLRAGAATGCGFLVEAELPTRAPG
jgi:signal transduction histidine kinase